MNDVIWVLVAFLLLSIIVIALPVLWMMAKEIGTIMRTEPPLQGPYFNDESE